MNIAFLYLFVACLSVMIISLIGVIFSWRYLKEWVQKYMLYLVSFSAGFFFVLSLHLVQESLELTPHPLWTLGALLTGVCIFYLISFVFPEGHHHHGQEDCHHVHNKNTARKMLIGDSVHNIGDGLLLAPVFFIDIHLGIITTFGILIHEAIQEMSEFIVLKESGYTTRQALLRNFIASSTILIGAFLGYFLSSSNTLVGILLGIAAGIFLYTVIVDLVPHSIKHSFKQKKMVWYLLWAFFGFLVLFGINKLAGHEEITIDQSNDTNQIAE